MSYQQPYGYPAPVPQTQQPQQPWAQTQQAPQWHPAPQPPAAQPPALPAGPAFPSHPSYAAEPTRVDPLGTEPTQQLPRSPWEPDHRR